MKGSLAELLQFDDEHENNVYIPNEIFDDFRKINKQNAKKESQSNYIAFTYSYYYLIMWLYKYAKYGIGKCIDQSMIKQILGYGEAYRESNFIIKRNGLLDQMKYTETVKEFPISWEMDESNNVEYIMFSELDKEVQEYYKDIFSRKFTVKLPVHAFNRYPNDEEMQQDYDEGYEDGVFSDIANTHNIPFEIFIHCMENKDIGCTGFYLYSYLKRMNDMHKEGYDVSLINLEDETGIKHSTLDKYLDILKKYRMIECIHNQEYFCLALSEKDRKANTYITKDYDLFLNKPYASYEKIKRVSVAEYKKIQKEIWGLPEVEIALEDLPY